MALLSFFEYTMRRTIFRVFFLEMHLQGIRDQSVASIYTELPSLVLAYLNSCLATCKNSLQDLVSHPGWAEDRGLAAPVHDFCTTFLNVGFCQYFYFLGFPVPLIVILCLWQVGLSNKSKVYQILGICYLLRVNYSAWKSSDAAKSSHHTGMCCWALLHAGFWFFLMAKNNNGTSKNSQNKDIFCKHDSHLRLTSWPSASCTEFL